VLTADIGRGLVEVAVMKAIKGPLGPLAPIPTVLDNDVVSGGAAGLV
jgi:hypothetical protein